MSLLRSVVGRMRKTINRAIFCNEKNNKKAQHHISCKQGILVTRITGNTRIIQCTLYIFNSPDQLAIIGLLLQMLRRNAVHSLFQIHWSFEHFIANAILVDQEWLQLLVAVALSCHRKYSAATSGNHFNFSRNDANFEDYSFSHVIQYMLLMVLLQKSPTKDYLWNTRRFSSLLLPSSVVLYATVQPFHLLDVAMATYNKQRYSRYMPAQYDWVSLASPSLRRKRVWSGCIHSTSVCT